MAYLGEEIKKLGFGLMRLPQKSEGVIDVEQTKVMVDKFMEPGFTYFDTPWAYAGSEDAIREAVGDKKGIKRYGSCILPMDEVLVLCAVDLSGRPYLGWDAAFSTEKIGDMATEMVKEFFYAVSYSVAMNLHIKVLSGGNSHHVAEAMFKSFAKALDAATQYDSRITDVLSTKGSL